MEDLSHGKRPQQESKSENLREEKIAVVFSQLGTLLRNLDGSGNQNSELCG